MKKKLNLDQINIQSFVTSMGKDNQETAEINGGGLSVNGSCHNSCGPEFTVHFGPCSVYVCP